MTDPQRRFLAQLDPSQQGLGLATIMDRALAAEHGIAYVHLAAFAIDVDRVHAERPQLGPFGWEVFVTEAYLVGRVLEAPDGDSFVELVEQICVSIVDTPAPRLGSQLAFSVFDAVQRGALPPRLNALFSEWKAAPRELLAELGELWKSPDDALASLAEQCLEVETTPALAPPSEETLHEMALGDWLLQ